MSKFIITVLILLAGSASGQILSSSAEVVRLKLYDTTQVRAGVVTRNHTIDIDSNSFTIKSWGDECEFRVDIKPQNQLAALVKPSLKLINGRPSFKTGTTQRAHELFVRRDGNFEWNIELATEPVNKTLAFPITTKGLIFYYQPKLTQAEIDEGNSRPDNIVDSYAVYHKDYQTTARNNYTDTRGIRNVYMTGKAFHIDKPFIYDEHGDTMWVPIYIDTVVDSLYMTIPNTWVSYPATIDPIFGENGIGGTEHTISGSQVRHCQFTMGGTSGEIDSITVYLFNPDGSGKDIGTAVYDDTGDDPVNLVDSSYTRVTVGNYVTDWIGSAHPSSVALTASTAYWLSMFPAGGIRMHYDVASTNYSEGHFNDPWPPNDPAEDGWNVYSNRLYSL